MNVTVTIKWSCQKRSLYKPRSHRSTRSERRIQPIQGEKEKKKVAYTPFHLFNHCSKQNRVMTSTSILFFIANDQQRPTTSVKKQQLQNQVLWLDDQENRTHPCKQHSKTLLCSENSVHFLESRFPIFTNTRTCRTNCTVWCNDGTCLWTWTLTVSCSKHRDTFTLNCQLSTLLS